MTDPVLIGPTPAPALQVATFNVRRRMPPLGSRSADRWPTRAPAVASLLTSERPSLIGVQEVLPDQDRAITYALGPSYRRVGHGREVNGGGEGCPIYYDSGRLELIEVSQQALSDTPDVAGSRSWGNHTPRTLVRAVFRDRSTSVRFVALNTHFDHLSRRSRVNSARVVRELVAAQPLPAIVTGDFNSGEDTAPLTELFRGGTLVDAWAAATERLTPEWGTFANYREPRTGRKRIDWIAVTPGVIVDRIGMNARRPRGAWPSDHLPVQAVITLPETT
jgi:endonuclease/exonuclease/phosphatase family metal-dependent hydrolase